MNRITLQGRLTGDPEVRTTQGERPTTVAKYALAVKRRFKEKEGNRETDFIPCVAFGKQAEFVENHLRKGMLILVEGRLEISPYEDRDGNKKKSTTAIVENHYFCEKKDGGGNSGGGPGPGADAAPDEGADWDGGYCPDW